MSNKRKYDFLRAEERYVKQMAPRPKTELVGEIKVPMPLMPDESLIKNNEAKKKKQYYTREKVPKDIAMWPKKVIDEYSASQWHRRIHGEWQFIKGKPYYIPGGAVPFFDYWTLESGRQPSFRYSALTLFWLFYQFVETNPDVFGIYVLKTRRIGDTANFIYMLWERVSRYFGVRAGLQSYNDTIARKTFARMAKGARNMPFFFRPNRSGSDREFLAYMSPNEVMSMKSIKEQELVKAKTKDSEFLSSFADYQPTVEGAYDGEQMFAVLLDEVLKIPPHRMDAIKQWNNLKRCLSLFGEMTIFGKGFASSTVEKREKKTGDDADKSSIEVGRWFWDNSDPSMLVDSPDKRTVSGMVRVFRGYQMAALPDEWGFPQVARATTFRDAKLEKAVKYNQPEMLTDIYRKEPATADEALIEDNDQCPLYPEICQMRRNQLRLGLDRYNEAIKDYRSPITSGHLKWKNDKRNTEVIFVPAPNGPWQISQKPVQPNKVALRKIKIRDEFGRPMVIDGFVPLNGALYRGGADPTTENPSIITRGSKCGIVVKRRWYLPHETADLEFDDNGVVQNPQDMVTNKVVATYLDRPYNPSLSFDEIVKVCWWYGMPVLLEMDKPEAYVYMRKHGYAGFVMFEPAAIANLRSRSGNMYPGVRSRGDIVGMYVTRLQEYIANYWAAIDHDRLLHGASRFIPAKRTRFDEVVAWGLAELGDMSNQYGLTGQQESASAWSHDPYAIAI